MSHSSWRSPMVPAQLGAVTSALEGLGRGTTLGSGEGQAWAGAVAAPWPGWSLPLNDQQPGRAVREHVELLQSSTDVLNCSSCCAECVLGTSEADFGANPSGAEFQGEEPW